MSSSVFKAMVKIRGINPFVTVSASEAERLKPGWRKALPVIVRIDGRPKDAWRTNLIPANDGGFYLYLNGLMRVTATTGHSIESRRSL